MTENKHILLAIAGIVMLLMGLVFIPFDNTHPISADVSNDLQYNLVHLPVNNYSCDYNIIQEVGGKNRTIDEINCATSTVVLQSTNASKIFNDVMTKINLATGGVVHFKGYGFFHPYNITTPIILPDSGNLELYGDGAQWSTLAIPTAVNNMNMFQLTGTKTADIYFNHFHDFQMTGNRSHGQTNTTGLYFNAINHGWHDSVMRNLFIEDFATDDVFVSSANSWNVQWENDVFEHAGQYNFDHTGGSDTRIIDSKFLFGHGTYSAFIAGGLNTIQSSWFYQNDKNGILVANSPNVIAGNKFFENGLSASNTYSDIAFSAGVASVINSNTFSGSDLANKPKCAINIADSSSINNEISVNNFTPILGGSYATAPICGFHASGVNTITNNVGWNPKGKVTSFIDNSGLYFVSQSGTTGTMVNKTTYTISDSPVFVTISGGTGVNITTFDNNNNVLQINQASLTLQYLPIGYKIKPQWATIPTISVYFH